MLEVHARPERVSLTPRSRWAVLGAAGVVGLVGLVMAALQHSSLSFVTYWCVLLLGTAAIAYHRWLEARRSMQPDHVLPSRWQRRAALVPVVLVLLSCAANAFVWATEAAKR